MEGERVTLTMWFSRDGSHDEDAKLISFLSQMPLNSKYGSYLPVPASNNMYWFPTDEGLKYRSGLDIRFARIHVLGFDLYSSQDKSFPALDSSCNFSELLIEPLQLAQGDALFDKEFVNILHVLQVLQFYFWKCSELQKTEAKQKSNNVVLPQSKQERIHGLKCVFLKDHQLAHRIFGHITCVENMEHFFDWSSFSVAVAAWEVYSCKLCKELLMSLPPWTTHQSIYSDV